MDCEALCCTLEPVQSNRLSCPALLHCFCKVVRKGSHAVWPQNQNFTSGWWRIYHISQIPTGQGLKTLPKDPCLCSNFPCPFTSPSRLFALTTDLPGSFDGHPNMVQGIIRCLRSWRINTLSRWVKVTKVMDILGVLLIRTLDDTRRYSSKIAITSRWWWIHNRYHISQIPFARCWRLFQKIPASVQIFHAFSPRDPDSLLSSLICQELPTGCLVEWTLRDLWRVLSQASLLPKQRHSFRKQEPYRYSRNLYLRWSYQCPNTTTAYRSDRNGKTQPTQGLGCTEGDLTASFPYAILLWSSTEQWSCKLVPRKSEQHRSSSIKKRKQMSRCRFQVALCGWCSFSKPWQWV